MTSFLNSIFNRDEKHYLNKIENLIKDKLKTFSELKQKYHFESIFRTTQNKYFSKKTKLDCIPLARMSRRPLDYPDNVDSDKIKPHIDIFEPIWYSTRLHDSTVYKNKDLHNWEIDKNLHELMKLPFNIPKPLSHEIEDKTCEYIPLDVTSSNKKLLFLDLTGEKDDEYYYIDKRLINVIYEYILKINEYYIEKDEIFVDNTYDNIFPISEVKSAYGYNTGLRNSERDIDRFFTLELFHIIDNIFKEKYKESVFMGYFHAHVLSSDEKEFDIINGHLPAEFTIPYGKSINKNYFKLFSPIKTESNFKSKSIKLTKKRKLSHDSHDSHDSHKKKGGKFKRKINKTKKRLYHIQ